MRTLQSVCKILSDILSEDWKWALNDVIKESLAQGGSAIQGGRDLALLWVLPQLVVADVSKR
ncbi:MAG: hypothetical protein M0T78_05655 [Actinomycetota bacterium]|nr:hypothetical protein [Actinomycetota bacterium]